MSSTDDRIFVPVSRYEINTNSICQEKLVIQLETLELEFLSHLIPFSDHLLQSFLERVFFAGCFTDGLKLLQVRFKVHLNVLPQSGVL